MFLQKEAVPAQTIRRMRKRPVVWEPAIAAIQATQKATVEAVTAMTAVCSEVLKMSGSTVSDWLEGRKFRTSQYSPRGMPVSAFHAVKSVISAEAMYNTAAVKIMVNVLRFFFLKKFSGDDWLCCRDSKDGRGKPVGRSNFMVFFLFRMRAGRKNTAQYFFGKFLRFTVKKQSSAA